MFLLRNKKTIDTFWLKKRLIKSYDGMSLACWIQKSAGLLPIGKAKQLC